MVRSIRFDHVGDLGAVDVVGCCDHDVEQLARLSPQHVALVVDDFCADVFAHAVLGVALDESFEQLLQLLDSIVLQQVVHVALCACCYCRVFACCYVAEDVRLFQHVFQQNHVLV